MKMVMLKMRTGYGQTHFLLPKSPPENEQIPCDHSVHDDYGYNGKNQGDYGVQNVDVPHHL